MNTSKIGVKVNDSAFLSNDKEELSSVNIEKEPSFNEEKFNVDDSDHLASYRYFQNGKNKSNRNNYQRRSSGVLNGSNSKLQSSEQEDGKYDGDDIGSIKRSLRLSTSRTVRQDEMETNDK